MPHKSSGKSIKQSVLFLWAALSFITVESAQASDEFSISDDASVLSFSLAHSYDESQGSLSVQIDGFDVSHFIVRNDQGIQLELGIPLDPGEHSVQVLLFAEDGSIITLLDHVINVPPPEGRQMHWNASALFSHSYEIDSKQTVDNASKHHSTGGVTADFSQEDDDWNWQGNIATAYDSNSDSNSDLNEWAIAQYKLSGESQGEHVKTGIALGHVSHLRESLLVSSFERRGLAGSISSPDQAHSMTVFAVRTEPSSRYDGHLSVPNNQDIRSIGAQSSVTIVDEHMLLSLGYIDGYKGQDSHDSNPEVVFGGSAWNTALDAYGFAQKLWFHAEYAESRFDSDGLKLGQTTQTDTAAQALLQWSTQLSDNAWIDNWSALARYQEVGPDFYSIGNLSLPGDLKLYQSKFEISRGQFALAFELAREQTNVDQQATLATQTLDRQDVSLNYSPAIDPDSPLWLWLGHPSLSAGITKSRHSQPRSDSLEQGFDLDQEGFESRLDMSFTADQYNWALSLQRVELEDNTSAIVQGIETVYEPGSDQLQHSVGVNGGWQNNSDLSLNLFAQWNRQREKDFQNTHYSKNFGVDGHYQILTDVLDLSLSYNYGIEESDFGSAGYVDTKLKSDYVSTKLTWHSLQAAAHCPGLVTYLDGAWSRQDESGGSSDESWSITIGIELAWDGSSTF